ncbi:MAG: cytochrome P450 [Rhodospirillaceae bacterium]|nr:cytochrome P450 [Rhodospirillaceae bacterium]
MSGERVAPSGRQPGALLRVDPASFAASPLPIISRLARRPERLIIAEVGTQRFVILTRPADARAFLGLDGDGLAKSYGSIRFIIGNGILTSHGQIWRTVRERIQPAFAPPRLVDMGADIVDAFDIVIDRWIDDAARQQPVDVMRGLVRATLDVLLRVLAGTDGRMLDDGDIDAINTALLAASRHAWLRGGDMYKILAAREPGFEQAMRRLDKVAVRLFMYQRNRTDTNGGADGDVLARLVAAHDDPTCNEMTRRQLRDELLTFLLVGHETTAVALAWALRLLGQHPDIQEALRREAAGVDAGMPAREALAAAPLATAVFRESMRLHPPIPVLPRILLEPYEIAGSRFKPGSFFALPVFAYHRDPAVWPEPKRFLPERFLGDDTTLRDSPSYMPFASGPRACLGSRFALTEGPLGLLQIVRRLKIGAPDTLLRPIPSAVTLRPESGPHLHLEAIR